MTLRLLEAPLPAAWDGRAVAWTPWGRALVVQICPPPKAERCSCGSTDRPFTSRGLRDPDAEAAAVADALPRIGRRSPLVYPLYDLHAFRCPGCGEVEVWDQATDERWTLDESDYGPTGSWAWSGGLLDALLTGEA